VSQLEADRALRVVLCDDSAIFREGLRMLLDSVGVQVVACVPDLASLFRATQDTRPDLALLDVRMPPTHTDEGIRAAITLHEAHPGTRPVVLSTYVEAGWALRLLEAIPDGVGYLLKDRVAHIGDLLSAMDRVAAGGVALDAEVASALVAQRRRTTPLDALTERELAVLALVAEGRSNAGIGVALHLSVKTVESHVAAIFRQLDLEATQSDNRRVRAALTYLSGLP